MCDRGPRRDNLSQRQSGRRGRGTGVESYPRPPTGVGRRTLRIGIDIEGRTEVGITVLTIYQG